MKLYLVNRITNAVHVIEITDLDILGKLPTITNVSKETKLLINNRLRKYGLTLLDGTNSTYTFQYIQVLALIISSSIPLEVRGASTYRDLSLPFAEEQRWWHFDQSNIDRDNDWQHLNCSLVHYYQTYAEILRKRITLQYDPLETDYKSFSLRCSHVLKLSKPYHPLLPTPEMLQDKKTQLLSDHLPQLFTVRDIKCLNWNIMHPGLGCGYSPFTDATDINLNIITNAKQYQTALNDQTDKRAQRIQISLAMMVRMQQAHLITLQENFLDEKQLNDLLNRFGSHWKLIFDPINPREVIFFDSNVIVLKSNSWQRPVLTAEFVTKQKDHQIVVHNVHFPHKEVPFETEAATLKLLQSAPGKTVIVIGDFNSRIPPLNVEPKLIVSGVTPKLFREGVQGCDWTDGCFALNANQTQPQQVEGEILNPTTGEKFRDNFYNVTSFDTATLGQRVELSRLRPFMAVTGQYLTASTPNGSHGELEGQLRNTLGDPDLKLGLAVNAFNRRSFFILSNALEKYKLQLPQEIVTHTDEKTGTTSTVLCCELKRFNTFFAEAVKSTNKSVVYSVSRLLFTTTTAFDSDTAITDDLMELSCFMDCFPEKPDSVESSRAVKEQLKRIIKSKSEVTQLCARLILANYCLHFTEYDEIERANMGKPKCPLLRPTHFQFAMEEYLAICTMFAKININTFTPLQRQIIRANLIALGNNIATIYAIFAGRFQEQVELFEKRVPKKQQIINKETITQSARNIVKTYQLVLTCQKILQSNDMGSRSEVTSDYSEIIPADLVLIAPPIFIAPPLNAARASSPPLLSPASIATVPETHSPTPLLGTSSHSVPVSNGSVELAQAVAPSAEEVGARSLATIEITNAPINLVKSLLQEIYPVNSDSLIERNMKITIKL